jgi:hypothetical protein
MMSARIWLTERRRHYEGYRRPPRTGLIVALLLLLAGTVWKDFYEVPFGLRSLVCDFRTTPWSGILTSPKFIFALPLLIAELIVWGWILIWIWPVPALTTPTAVDWLLVGIVFLVAASLYIFQVAATFALAPVPRRHPEDLTQIKALLCRRPHPEGAVIWQTSRDAGEYGVD